MNSLAMDLLLAQSLSITLRHRGFLQVSLLDMREVSLGKSTDQSNKTLVEEPVEFTVGF